MSTRRSGRGGAPRRACRIGLVMWYGRLATTSYGGSTSRTRSWSSASPSISRSVSIALEPLAQEGRQAAIELDRGHLGAGRQQPAREQAEPRADLEDPPARRRIRLGEDRVEDVGIGQEVLRQGVACAEPGRAERERGPSPGRRGPPRAPLTGRPAAATVGRRGRAGRARPRRTVARRPPRSSPRCRCTAPAAAR